MKTLKIIILTLAAALSSSALAVPLVYDVSTPVSGQGQLGISDFGNNTYSPRLYRDDAALVTFGTLQETVYFDPEAGTLRQTGYVPLMVSDQIVMHNAQQVNGEAVDGVLSINQTFSRDRYHFDTGELPLAFDSATTAHITGRDLGGFDPLPRVNASWSLLTGGETYTGAFSYQLGYGGEFYPFQDITFSSEDPSSITLDHMHTGFFPSYGISVLQRNGPITGENMFTADNGYTINLRTGIDDFTDYFYWSVGPIVASIQGVPDSGSTLGLLALSIAGLVCWRKRLAIQA